MYSSITCEKLRNLIGKVNIIDIRDNYLYQMGSIPSSKNIPINYLVVDPSKYLNKNDVYYIYCSFGHQSTYVCSKLYNMGYNVVNVIGGYDGYFKQI